MQKSPAPPYINRELSWLEFNQRVLDQARREDLPLLERVKFLAITASNLDEFFQVRIGGLMAMRRTGIKKRDDSGLTPTRSLAMLRQRILRMMEEQYALFNDALVPALADAGIRLLATDDVSIEKASQLAATFEDQIFPLLTPLAVDEGEAPPVIPALQLIVACRLHDSADQTTRHALVPIPDSLPRRIGVTGEDEGLSFILIEDLVAMHAARLFPGETVTASTTFRITRNSDIAVQEEDTIDLADEMEDVLTARRFADTVRLELRADAPRDLAAMLRKVTAAGPQEIYQIDGPPGLASFMELAFLPDHDHLRDPDWPAQTSPAITPGSTMFETISSGDVLLFHPYESFEPVLRLLEEAAADPDVLAIKQVLYRTAKKSRVIDALIKAAENG
ncbi:MAG TPA: polyphosphate kinase 1, partial [Luteolibacter sp.]|nr:polyphosphate kinase 1 [Luteolibacter sp.]